MSGPFDALFDREWPPLSEMIDLGAVYQESLKLDPRDPDPSKEGVFRDHNCWKCREGKKPCVRGEPRRCEFLHARND